MYINVPWVADMIETSRWCAARLGAPEDQRSLSVALASCENTYFIVVPLRFWCWCVWREFCSTDGQKIAGCSVEGGQNTYGGACYPITVDLRGSVAAPVIYLYGKKLFGFDVSDPPPDGLVDETSTLVEQSNPWT